MACHIDRRLTEIIKKLPTCVIRIPNYEFKPETGEKMKRSDFFLLNPTTLHHYSLTSKKKTLSTCQEKGLRGKTG